MNAKLIDTNVPVIADGDRSPQATKECRLACIDMLKRLTIQGEFKLVVDLQWIILKEYKNNLERHQGGLGEQFLQWVLTHFKTPDCILVRITPDGATFKEFPNSDPALTKFDVADRKWIAAALVHQQEYELSAPIMQAADNKWRDFQASLTRHGIVIEFICEVLAPSK